MSLYSRILLTAYHLGVTLFRLYSSISSVSVVLQGDHLVHSFAAVRIVFSSALRLRFCAGM